MKKAFILIISLTLLTGCTYNTESSNLSDIISESNVNTEQNYNESILRETYPEFFDLDTSKGLEVYVWQMEETVYRCGLMEGTDRSKTDKEIWDLQKISASIEDMKDILACYNLPKEYIYILPCEQPVSNYSYDIDADYCKKFKIFLNNKLMK